MKKDQNLVLKGSGIYLRRLKAKDWEEFTTLARRSVRFHRGLLKLPKTREAYELFRKRVSGEASECFLICRAEDDAIAGVIHMAQIFRGPLQSAYLGYGLGVDFIGKGYASNAVRVILRFAFHDLKLHRLEANIQPHNLPSIALVKQLGFSKEGYSPKYLKVSGKWCDHERWAITKENWK